SAIALTFGTYAFPEHGRWAAAGVVLALTGVNYAGVRKTAWVTRALVAVVLACLGVVVSALLAGGTAAPQRLGPVWSVSPWEVLRAAGLLFFAFAGYARIATLGEEVTDPARTIPRAIPAALGITLLVYAVVAGSALLAAGPRVLAEASAPLDAAVRKGSFAWLSIAARVVGTVAALGVLLSLLAGVSRTSFAMASNGHLPRWLEAVHPTRRVPHHAEVAIGGTVVLVVLVLDLKGALGFSAFVLLAYYAIANASAWTLSAEERRWPRFISAAGFSGCVLLAVALPMTVVATGAGILGLGVAVWVIRGRIFKVDL
ncbi:MAG: APC family permease, partial [Actinobacteria bacterium]|nr:APC family permease [Actinomycetota bacterium]